MDKFEVFSQKKANIGYVVGGYPSVDYFKDFINNLDDSVIDILEIGIPYSDPIADGPVIFNASFSAVQAGVTTDTIFEALLACKTRKTLVFLVYYNMIFAYGEDEFLKKAKECGISGIIIPDLPYEENEEFYEKCQNLGISLIPLVSVTSVHRVDNLLKRASGFIYAVGALGVTGTKQTPLERLQNMVAEIKTKTNLPVAVGFGIRTAKDVEATKKYADGAIIGTSIVEITANSDVSEVNKKIAKLFNE